MDLIFWKTKLWNERICLWCSITALLTVNFRALQAKSIWTNWYELSAIWGFPWRERRPRISCRGISHLVRYFLFLSFSFALTWTDFVNILNRNVKCFRMDQDGSLNISYDEWRDFLLLAPSHDIHQLIIYWRHSTVSLWLIAKRVIQALSKCTAQQPVI